MDNYQERFTRVAQNILGDWDTVEIESILYVEFLLAVEKEFSIKFSAQEFATLRTLELVKENVRNKLLKRIP